MRATTPTIFCDAEDGECGAWDVDWYASDTTTVGSTKITREQPAPGWRSSDRPTPTDLCPKHAEELRCTHCNRGITEDEWPVHTDGNYTHKSRCDPNDSQLPYGYNAHRTGTPCTSPCAGSTTTTEPTTPAALAAEDGDPR